MLPSAQAGVLVLFLALGLFQRVPLAHSARSSPPSAPAQTTAPLEDSEDSTYNQPIIFFEENSTILVFYPNGDILHRGRKLTNDYEVVKALQEILSLSPCRRSNHRVPQEGQFPRREEPPPVHKR